MEKKAKTSFGKNVLVFVPERHYKALERMAEEEGAKVVVMVRECIRREAERRGMWQEEEGYERT